jgi:hypothetical protein
MSTQDFLEKKAGSGDKVEGKTLETTSRTFATFSRVE